jgi:membrane-associated phospholipid phosphatase
MGDGSDSRVLAPRRAVTWVLSLRGSGLRLAVAFVAILVTGWALGELAESVHERDDLARRDGAVTAWIVAHRTDWLTSALRVLTDLGGIWFALPLVVASALIMPLRGSRLRTGAMVLLVTGGTSLLVNAIKLLMARPRPTLSEVVAVASGFSFPSGHSAQAVAAYASLAYLIGRRWPARAVRIAAWSAAGLVALVVGFSRLYLGVHWLTDVLGGYLLAALWTTIVWTSARLVVARRRRSAEPP